MMKINLIKNKLDSTDYVLRHWKDVKITFGVKSTKLKELFWRQDVAFSVLLIIVSANFFILGRMINSFRPERNNEPILIGGISGKSILADEKSEISKTVSKSTIEKSGPITKSMAKSKTTVLPPGTGTPGSVFASKRGKNYYYPGCGGGTTIKPANKVWFTTPKAAELKGYVRSKTCKI